MHVKPLLIAIALGLGTVAGGVDAVVPDRSAPIVREGELPLWLIQFEEPAAASFRGFPAGSGRPALAPTSREVTGERKYDASSQAARAYVGYLEDLRRVRLAEFSERLGRQLRPVYTYEHAINGVALHLSAEEAERVRHLPGVRNISPNFVRYPQTDRGPQWINADDIWNGTITGVGSHRGAGQIIGVIDTGINRTHVAFGAGGITNPRGAGNYLGYCINTPSACNNKVIGLYDFVANTTNGRADPVDSDGHGTHTAATSGGRSFQPSTVTYSGVAPFANLVIYKACPGRSCDGAALVASIDQAVADGVDVINYSIGGGPIDPWFAVGNPAVDDTEAFLAAREAGIVVAAAAGNDGPDPGTHGNPANSPWVLGVAAATHDRNGVAQADRLASFSGRGPVIPLGVIKPDVTAPGVSIISAGLGSTNAIATMSGTSMATPHVAGAAALLKSAKPTWTDDQIMSALVLTARSSIKVIGPILGTPHEQGAGMIDVALAAQAGLYLEVEDGAFRAAAANPFTGGAEQLNLPSLGHGACFRTCVLTRKFYRMPGAAASSYSISVSGLPAGASVTPNITSFNASNAGTTVNFTVNVNDPRVFNTWVYGTVTLTNTSGDGRPDLHLPIAVFATPFMNAAAEAAMTSQERTITAERGFFDIDVPGMTALGDARFDVTPLFEPVITTQNIAVDPTNDTPYDSATGTYVRLVTVPAAPGKRIILSATTSAPNPDIDLYVGRDTDNDGKPDENEELCVSGNASSNESCEINLLGEASPITFWVMAQNWSGPGTSVRVETLAVVLDDSADTTQLTATGPGNIPHSTPFKLRVAWDDPTIVPGSVRVGYVTTRPSASAAPVYTRVRLVASGATEPGAFGLSPGVARPVTLPAGAAHERLYFDVPPGVTKMTLR
ncbi:S8 family serine peptidase, partial [Arenimonas composti]